MRQHKETWLPVPVEGFEDAYEVSNFGRVRSVDREMIVADRHGGFHVRRYGSRLKQLSLDKDGYLRVALYKQGLKFRFVPVHRLVALVFVPNPSDLPEVDHEDSDRANARATNLSWVTNVENTARSVARGRTKRGEDNPDAHLTAKQVQEIRVRAAAGERFVHLGVEFGVSDVNIGHIVRRHTWRHV